MCDITNEVTVRLGPGQRALEDSREQVIRGLIVGKVPSVLRHLGPRTKSLALSPLSRFCLPAKPYPNMSSSSNNSVLSDLAVLTIRVPSNNQASRVGVDNQVTMEDIKHFANLNTTIENNSTNCLIHCGANPPQQISHLDICVHNQSRTGWGPGTYPTNYEVGRDDSVQFEHS